MSEWGELVLDIGDFNGHVGKQIEGYEDVHGGNGIGERNMEGKVLLELCVANTWFRKGEKRKVTYSAGGNELEIDFVLVGKGNRRYLRDVKVIPGELQHRLVVVDLVKKVVKIAALTEEALCILVRRFAYPCQYVDLTPQFGRSPQESSRFANKVMDEIYEMHGHLVANIRSPISVMQNSTLICFLDLFLDFFPHFQKIVACKRASCLLE